MVSELVYKSWDPRFKPRPQQQLFGCFCPDAANHYSAVNYNHLQMLTRRRKRRQGKDWKTLSVSQGRDKLKALNSSVVPRALIRKHMTRALPMYLPNRSLKLEHNGLWQNKTYVALSYCRVKHSAEIRNLHDIPYARITLFQTLFPCFWFQSVIAAAAGIIVHQSDD